MAERLEKVPIASAGPEDVEQSPMPPTYSTVMAKPSSAGRLLRIGAMVLTGGAVLLFGAIGAFYYWKVNDKEATISEAIKRALNMFPHLPETNSRKTTGVYVIHKVYKVHYTMSINGQVQEGSMEIDAGNNLETFKTGSGEEKAIEVHDFQIGITGIRFAGGEKCYIKAQAKTHIPEVNAMTKESLSFDLEDEIMPVKFDENSLVWVAAEQPIKNSNFLSPKILELCEDLQIFWLRPSYPKVGQRRKRGAARKARQTQPNLGPDQPEPAAEVVTTRPRPSQRAQQRQRSSNATGPSARESRPDFNPDNPYHQLEGGEVMTFDPRLDHEGVCCIECRRSYTHCQRICEPLLGYYPWPYNYQGCRSACRLIMPCSWWVARILGIV